MKRSKYIRPEWNKDEGGGAKKLLRFLGRHGEKFVAGVLIVGALWLALRVLDHQPLPWQPNELEDLANSTEEVIRNNEPVISGEGVRIFNYGAHAEQIRESLSIAPYRGDASWYPVIHPAPQPRGGFEILTAKSLRAEAVRKTGVTVQGRPPEQWQGPSLPRVVENDATPAQSPPAIWVNLHGTLPVWEQWDIYHQVLSSADPAHRPEYAYYELEKTEIKQGEMPVWNPVIVFTAGEHQTDRLIPFKQQQEALQNQDLLLYSDFDVEPAKTYAYRIRLYVRNPNYNLQATSVQEGVNTQNEFIRSDWSSFARVYVPDRTLVQLRSIALADSSVFFPRQAAPLNPIRGTLFLDYFDTERGVSLPLVEKTNVLRGMLGNMSSDEANRYINRGNPGEIVAGENFMNFPEGGLRSNVCVMDFSGGRLLQRRSTREAQASPELSIPSKALLLMPDGTMQITSTEPELFR